MLNKSEELSGIYKDAEWIVVKNQSGAWLRIADVGGLSLVAKWIRNDLIQSKHFDCLGDSIKTLGLPNRVLNALHKKDVVTIGDLCSKSKLDLYCMPGLGELSRQQIIDALEERNLKLKS
jgi:hypothetical protein